MKYTLYINYFYYIFSHCSVLKLYFLTTFAGIPTAIEYSGMSFVTTAFAPIIDPCEIFTPGRIETFSPTHTLSPISTGLVEISLSLGAIFGLVDSFPL